MTETISLLLPLVGVLLGGVITYFLNVRQARRTKVDDVFHEAIAAIAVAHTAHDFITQVAPWRGAADVDYQAFTSQLGREGNLGYVRAVAAARAALARASAYDPSLKEFLSGSDGPGISEAVYDRADEIMARLRGHIEDQGGRRH